MKTMNDDDEIRKALHQKRKKEDTSCSTWKNIGIKYFGDRKMWDKLYDWEINYYNSHHRKQNLNE